MKMSYDTYTNSVMNSVRWCSTCVICVKNIHSRPNEVFLSSWNW